MSCREACLGEGEDDIDLHLSRCGVDIPVTGVGIWIYWCIYSGSVGLSTS